MHPLVSRFALGTGLLLGLPLGVHSAEPSVRFSLLYPSVTNSPSPFVKQYLSLTPPLAPFFQRDVATMFDQRFREHVTDSLQVPLTLGHWSRTEYDAFVHTKGKQILVGAGKQTARDWATGRILPSLEWRENLLSALTFGTLAGVQERDMGPLLTTYRSNDDSLLHPADSLPLRYSGGLRLGTNPKFYTTLTSRHSTRVLRLQSGHKGGEVTFDIHDGPLLVRAGGHFDYGSLQERSYGFVSFSPRQGSLPWVVTVGSDVRGNMHVTAGIRLQW